MLDSIPSLLGLSRVDSQVSGLEKQRAALPGERAALAEERAKAAESVTVAEAALGEAEQEQRRHEAAVADQEALATRLEGQQHQVKTNEAYTALLHEIDAARAAISEAETGVLEAMEAIEECRATLERARGHARSVEERTAEADRALDEREKSLDRTLAELAAERETLANGLDAALRTRYERIASRRAPPVALVRGETCLGCRVSIPPQRVIEMRRGEELISCDHCSRLLVPEALAEEAG